MPRRVLPLLALLVPLALAVGVACDFGDGEPAEPPAEARLVFAEFGPGEDRIYVAPAADLDARELLASVPHAQGWALTPATQLAGSLIAFVALPPEAEPRRDSPAELWLLDAASGELTRLAGDADLLVPPVFDREGRYLVYRSSDGSEGMQALVRVDLATRERRTVRTLTTRFGILPVAVPADGGVVYAELSTGGTDLYRVGGDGEGDATLLLHASDHIASGWRLSPDGRTLSYLAPRIEAERVVQRLHVTPIDGRGEPRIEAAAGFVGDQFSPVWTPAGDAITFGQEPGFLAGVAPLTLRLEGDDEPGRLTAPEQGFDAPLGWSGDGRYLATRSFDGRDAYEPGRESLVVIASAGGRTTVLADFELIFIGWLLDA